MYLVYRAVRHGGEATIADGTLEASLAVSDLEEPLTALTQALLAILHGNNRATATWIVEPGTYRWEFQRVHDRLAIGVRYFNTPRDRPVEPDGSPVFVSECPLVDFVTQVIRALREVLDEHGLEGYRTLSPHGSGFPYAEYEELRQFRRVLRAANRGGRRPETSQTATEHQASAV